MGSNTVEANETAALTAPNNSGTDSSSRFETTENLTNTTFGSNQVEQGTISNDTNLANEEANNPVFREELIQNTTPPGYTVDNTTETVTTDASTGRTITTWQAGIQQSGGVLHRASIEQLKLTELVAPAGAQAAIEAAYVEPLMSPTAENVSYDTTDVVHAVAGLSTTGRYVERLMQSTINVYHESGSVVIGATNLPSGMINKMNISDPTIALRNVSLVLRNNYTHFAAGITESAANTTQSCASLSCWRSSLDRGIAGDRPPGLIYAYLYINSTVNDSGIASVRYGLNVSKAWLTAHNIAPNEVGFYRANSSVAEWDRLPLTMVGQNATQYFYTAASPGLSLYVISAYRAPQQVNASTTTVTAQGAQRYAFSDVDVYYTMVIVIIVIFVWYVYTRRRK